MPMSIISQCILSAARNKVSYFIKVEYNIIMSLGIFGIFFPSAEQRFFIFFSTQWDFKIPSTRLKFCHELRFSR